MNRLLKGGADINARGVRQHRPLHVAVANGCVDTIKALLKGGADTTNILGALGAHDFRRELVDEYTVPSDDTLQEVLGKVLDKLKNEVVVGSGSTKEEVKENKQAAQGSLELFKKEYEKFDQQFKDVKPWGAYEKAQHAITDLVSSYNGLQNRLDNLLGEQRVFTLVTLNGPEGVDSEEVDVYKNMARALHSRRCELKTTIEDFARTTINKEAGGSTLASGLDGSKQKKTTRKEWGTDGKRRRTRREESGLGDVPPSIKNIVGTWLGHENCSNIGLTGGKLPQFQIDNIVNTFVTANFPIPLDIQQKLVFFDEKTKEAVVKPSVSVSVPVPVPAPSGGAALPAPTAPPKLTRKGKEKAPPAPAPPEAKKPEELTNAQVQQGMEILLKRNQIIDPTISSLINSTPNQIAGKALDERRVASKIASENIYVGSAVHGCELPPGWTPAVPPKPSIGGISK